VADHARFQRSVLEFVRDNFLKLRADMTVESALQAIRAHGIGEQIVYFYAVDDDDRLVGVLPTRRLLGAAAEAKLRELINRRVVALPETATLLDACDFFVLHRLYAFPVLDGQRRILGIIDVQAFTEELLDLEAGPEADDTVFETLGFHAEQIRGASAWKAFRVRFPWLLATIASGTGAALLAGAFEATLTRAIVVSFFLALVLALAEAVSIQSMTLTLQALRTMKPTWRWFSGKIRRECGTGALIGLAAGTLVLAIAWLWRRHLPAATVIGGTIAGSLLMSGLVGLSVPSALHALKLDPKIAAGPITLALADLLTLLLYFSLASWLL
jgi:magnesium transporter